VTDFGLRTSKKFRIRVARPNEGKEEEAEKRQKNAPGQ